MPANGRWPYSTPQWTAIRLLVLARDGYTCTARNAGPHTRPSVPLQVDHIEPWTRRPDLAFDPTNLQTLCSRHHNHKTHKSKRRRNTRRW